MHDMEKPDSQPLPEGWLKKNTLPFVLALRTVARSIALIMQRPLLPMFLVLLLFALLVAPAWPQFAPYKVLIWLAASAVVLFAAFISAVAAFNHVRNAQSHDMDLLQHQLNEAKARIKNVDERVVRSLDDINGKLTMFETMAAESAQRLEANAAESTQHLEAKVAESAQRLEAKIDTLDSALSRKIQQVTESTESLQARTKDEHEAVTAQLAELRDQACQFDSLLNTHTTQIEELEATQAALQNLGDDVSSINNSLERLRAEVTGNRRFQRFNRRLSDEHIEVLIENWQSRLGLEFSATALAYLAHRICMIEDNAAGRLATSIENAVLRTLVASAPKGNSLEVLEIGTLFGLGLSIIYDYCRARYDHVRITALDPLDGYYEKRTPDILLNIPVTREVFWRNLQNNDVPTSNVNLIQDLSTTESAHAEAARKSYDLLIIDGDHSYDGVAYDFEHYVDLVKPGGYIIFDDYNSTDWPEVRTYVDDVVKPREDVEFVGAQWRTAVFQRVG